MIRGPAHGLPILVKDLIDVVGMYTSAGNFSLRDNFPPRTPVSRRSSRRAA